MAEWRKVRDEIPEPFVNVFVVDPEVGVIIGYYDSNHQSWFTALMDDLLDNVYWWQPLVYPEAPEGSVGTDWD